MSDMQSFLKHMNNEDFVYVDEMSVEEVKKISPYVLLMWCQGAKKNRNIHTILTNTYCNPYVFSMAKHPRFLLKLFVAANGGIDDTHYSFVKPAFGSTKTSEVSKIAKYYQVSYRVAKEYIDTMDIDEKERILGLMENAIV